MHQLAKHPLRLLVLLAGFMRQHGPGGLQSLDHLLVARVDVPAGLDALRANLPQLVELPAVPGQLLRKQGTARARALGVHKLREVINAIRLGSFLAHHGSAGRSLLPWLRMPDMC